MQNILNMVAFMFGLIPFFFGSKWLVKSINVDACDLFFLYSSCALVLLFDALHLYWNNWILYSISVISIDNVDRLWVETLLILIQNDSAVDVGIFLTVKRSSFLKSKKYIHISKIGSYFLSLEHFTKHPVHRNTSNANAVLCAVLFFLATKKLNNPSNFNW